MSRSIAAHRRRVPIIKPSPLRSFYLATDSQVSRPLNKLGTRDLVEISFKRADSNSVEVLRQAQNRGREAEVFETILTTLTIKNVRSRIATARREPPLRPTRSWLLVWASANDGRDYFGVNPFV